MVVRILHLRIGLWEVISLISISPLSRRYALFPFYQHSSGDADNQGFQEALDRGQLTGHQINGCRFILEDGSAHVQDSNELSFRLAAIGAFKEAFAKAKPVVMEPVMTVEIVAPVEFQGNVIGAINQRKGTIIDTEVRDDEFTLTAEVALNDMFGYSSQLRGMTQGKGESNLLLTSFLS
jgi:elongation factor G